MKKFCEWSVLIVLVIIMRGLVNFFFPDLFYWGKFLLIILLGAVAILAYSRISEKVSNKKERKKHD